MTTRAATRRALAAYEKAVEDLLDALEREQDAWLREKTAKAASEYARDTQDWFGDSRAAAIRQLRGEGFSLTELHGELGISRARIAQIAPIEGDRA